MDEGWYIAFGFIAFIWASVVTFFGRKILSGAHKLEEFNPKDLTKLVHVSTELEKALRGHIKKNDEDVADFHRRLGDIELRQKDIIGVAQQACKFVPGRNNIKP